MNTSYARLTACDLRDDGGCGIHNATFCGGLSPEDRRRLNGIAHIRQFSKGSTIIAEEERPEIVGNVISGVLKMQRTQADGSQQIVGLLVPTDMFGRVYEDSASFAIEAATDVTLCCFDRKRFEALMEECPALEHQVMLSLLNELDAAREWIALLGLKTVAQRFAAFLLILCRRWRYLGCGHASKAQRLTVSVPIGRADMALYLGTTAETISRTAQTLVRKGILKMITPAQFEVLDLRALAALAGEDDFDVTQVLGTGVAAR